MKPVVSLSVTFILVTSSVALMAFLSPDRPVNPAAAHATYTAGALQVSIPNSGPRSGAGNLSVEILDPEDHIVAHLTSRVDAGRSQAPWAESLPLPKTLTREDVVWHRLRYRFTYDNEVTPAAQGIYSISQILRRPIVHVVGQKSYLAGSQAAVRLIATDSANQTIPSTSSVEIQLLDSNRKPRTLFTGKLNERGTTQAQFRFPAGLAGTYSLRYAVDTPIGPAEYAQAIELDDKIAILLTTEKPIYQPSQTIHIRALALDRSNHQASAGRPLTFELEDSRGNKVFRKVTQTDSFGIASAEFALADEVNLGAYHLRALMDPAGETLRNTAEIALQVDRYVLPRFKVQVDLAADANAKHGYRPGGHVRGTIRANYFFGNSVDGAPVTVKASAIDVSLFEAASEQGKTDADGAFHFDIRLPNYFAGRPLSQGAARVLIEATVKDGAGHSETRSEPITVSESPLLITAVPESGLLAAGLENQVFILTSYPDGAPAQVELRVEAQGNADQIASTDAGGIAIVRLRAKGDGAALRIDAKDHEGNTASSSIPLRSHSGPDQILLRSERAVYRAGERMQLQVLSTRQRGSAYIDVVKEGQTVATRDLDIVNGRADLDFIATAELAGTLEINAYLFGEDARPVGDHRLLFVQPADELKIESTLDAPAYKPGGEARIGFHVTNAHGEGVQAALGLQVVDQAVFALAEKQPGFAKVFFYLEQEAMKPRYEIHSVSLPEAISSTQRDRAARALFAATEMVDANNSQLEFGRIVPQQKYTEYVARYEKQFGVQIWKLASALSSESESSPQACDAGRMQSRFEAVPAANRLDSWGNPLRIENAGWNRGMRFLAVRSAGPDGQFNTTDDLVQQFENPNCVLPGSGRIDAQFEHDRGPFNALAEIAGTVIDPTGAVISGAAIQVRALGDGAEHTLTADANGRFSLAGVRPGRYHIQVTSAGFQIAARELTLQARDRAILSVTLNVGATTETVEVTAGAQILPAPKFERLAVRAMSVGALQPVARDVPMESKGSLAGPKLPAGHEPHVRSWFPEALYVTPEIVTDGQGRASVTIPIADNITTWRMAMLASTAHGSLGNATSSLKVLQDFFTDIDLPVTLTQGDQVSIPVAVYNYSGARGNVRLRLRPDDWFAAQDPLEKTLAVDSGRVGGSQFTIEAKRIGKFKLTLKAQMDGAEMDDRGKRADIVVRAIEVVPNGREQTMAFNGRLDSTVRQQVDFPSASIADASAIFVRVYPGPLSQIIEGMDSLIRMPYGCFEQTSSATYPNVLALDYMKRTKKATPEVHAKAEGFIATGYQRLLTFEVPGGGFSWFGNPPANKILTSYGLMEFADMSKVYDIDPKVIARTQQWLAGQQQADGSWKPDSNFINEGATNRYNADVLRITAYIAWSLENTGYQGPAVEKAKQFIEAHLNAENRAQPDVYTLALLANFAADYAKDRAFTNRVAGLLLDARTEQEGKAWWNTEETNVYSTGPSAIVETTGLAVQALLKWGGNSAVVAKATGYIVAKKDANGAWGTTQATVMALRALLLASEKGGATAKGAVEVVLNGETVDRLTLTAENNDLLHQFVLKGIAAQSANLVEIRFTGEGSLAYQVAGRYFLPWNQKPANEPLSIAVSYDRTHLAQDDIATATATVRNDLAKTANMVMVDLGIPPGFELLTEDLQTYLEKSARKKSGRLEKFNLTATQAILYFDSIAPHDEFALTFRLRAKYPIRARTFASRVYEYYSPEVGALAAPVQLEVHRR